LGLLHAFGYLASKERMGAIYRFHSGNDLFRRNWLPTLPLQQFAQLADRGDVLFV
jgi:hypothetical protein